MDNNFSNILNIFKRLDEGTMTSAEKHKSGSKFGGYWAGTDSGTPNSGEGVGSCNEDEDTLESRLRARWEETKAQKGLQEYGMTTGGTVAPGATTPPPAPGAPAAPATTNTVPADPAVAAKQKADMQKSLQGIPGVDANKAVTDLTNPKDVSGLNVAVANALANPATAQKAKDLLATGMKTGQPGGAQ